MPGSKVAALAALLFAVGSVNAVPCAKSSTITTSASATAVSAADDSSSTSSSTKTKKTKTSSSSTVDASSASIASYSTASAVATGTASASAATGTASAATGANSTSSADIGTSAITAPSGCTLTDFSAVADAVKACSTIVISAMTVPGGETLDLSDVADGTVIQFQGTTTWEYNEWEGPLLQIEGTSLTISGADGHVLDGQGASYWDGEGSNGGKTKPKFFAAHDLTDSTIADLNFLNAPVQLMSINGASNLTVSGINYDNSAGAGDDGGHNTDAFDVGSSTGVTITGSTIVNQDDCLAVNSGTDITFSNNKCTGGHGISIGSVGGRDDNTVSNVKVSDCTVTDSMNGVRIKTVSGATGQVSGVSYSGITLSGITDYGIVIEQDYENGSPTGTPTDGVPITDLTIENVTGTVTDDAEEVYILCASCSDWTWSGVSITGGSASTKCEGVPTGASC